MKRAARLLYTFVPVAYLQLNCPESASHASVPGPLVQLHVPQLPCTSTFSEHPLSLVYRICKPLSQPSLSIRHSPSPCPRSATLVGAARLGGEYPFVQRSLGHRSIHAAVFVYSVRTCVHDGASLALCAPGRINASPLLPRLAGCHLAVSHLELLAFIRPSFAADTARLDSFLTSC
jgi:hypothetical protein